MPSLLCLPKRIKRWTFVELERDLDTSKLSYNFRVLASLFDLRDYLHIPKENSFFYVEVNKKIETLCIYHFRVASRFLERELTLSIKRGDHDYLPPSWKFKGEPM